MANWFQRAIYNLANAVPLAGMTALAWYLEFRTWRIPIILIAVAIVVTILFAICFRYGINNCSIKNINVSKIVSKDSWLVVSTLYLNYQWSFLLVN